MVKIKLDGKEFVITDKEAERLERDIQVQLMELDLSWIAEEESKLDIGVEKFASYQLRELSVD